MKKQNQSKRQMFFDPDAIATAVHQALERDFNKAQHEYCLNDSTTLYAFNRQVNELRKKFVSQSEYTDVLVDRTFRKFLEVNDHMSEVNERLKFCLPTNQARITSTMPRMEKIHRRARAIVHSVLGPFEKSEWFAECRNSGGSSIGVPFSDTSNDRKFTFPMSVTKRAKTLFQQCMVFDFQLKAAIVDYNSLGPIMDPYMIVEESRATTVDKNDQIRRFICVEPTCNMYLQQGLMHMMYKRMKSFGLDVETLPELHKKLAKYSSITSRNATIDWASASDCGSIELLRWLIPPKWFEVLDTVRQTHTLIEGKRVKLNMFSTMGNAATFPLETLVFWAYAHAVRLTNRRSNTLFPEWEDLGCCSVFGDDCIVPSEIASEFIEVMTEVGFIINDQKSYYGTEQFRESCGGDYLAGYDVRPYFLKAPHSTKRSSLEPWLYIITNSFLKKYKSYFGTLSYVYDKELFRVLFGLFRKHKINIKLVPSFYPDDSGLKLSHDILRFHRHYPLKLQKVKRSHHGSYSFNFCRFVYFDKREKDDAIRYALWLKRPVQVKRIVPPGTFLRKKGGYVVAKGLTSHWFVPTVR